MIFGLFAILLGGIMIGIGIGSYESKHVHDFYDYGENFTFVDFFGTTCGLLFCSCGETKSIPLNDHEVSQDYKKDIL